MTKLPNYFNANRPLLPVWAEIEKYIDAGISVIPVRDRDEGAMPAKTPYGNWKQYQVTPLTKEQLFELMDTRYNTTAVGIICGKVSRDLEAVDIDVKYKPGIDATLFTDLNVIYPSLSEKLRIHKTPSGGYHIPYRCEEPIPGNQKLAGRYATEEELKERPKNKIYNFIETRGEGGYFCAPPALGYSVVKDVPIPVLTLGERNSLISLCRSYNEIITPEKAPYKPTKSEDAYYDTNPFEDFNSRCNPSELVQEFGWKEFKHNNHFVWYTRPGKAKGVSMSFNLQKRFFFCFTASTELEENKGYSPANLLALLAHRGDKKRLYADLVQRGYGRIKPKVEQRMAKTAAINGKPLPTNASQEALSARAALAATIDELHPFGTFWIDSMEKGIIIDRFKLYSVAPGLGFKNYKEEIVRITSCGLSSVGVLEKNIKPRYVLDTLKNYIKEEDADLHRDIFNALDAFWENHCKHVTANLPIINEEEILSDSIDTAYKIFENGILEITAAGYSLLPFTDKLIWRHKIHNRSFSFNPGGRYMKFLKLALDWTVNKEYFLSCIGYLAHEYKDETTGYIIVLTEQCENPKDGGGAGKNVFSELFRHTTSFTSKPGSQVKIDEKFMQSWNGEKIFCISDVPKGFQFIALKEMAGGTGLMKKLFKNETSIPAELMPKLLLHTNYSVEITDGGLKRRVKIIEFTDFFTKAGGIDVHFGVHFPNGWNNDDWNGYDTLISEAIQYWLKVGRKIGGVPLSESGWLKQFEQSWGAVVTAFIEENFSEWISRQRINNDEFKKRLEMFYRENNITSQYQPSMQKINLAIGEYCRYNGIEYKSDVQRTENGIHNKYRVFTDPNILPF
ncbi:MAG: bifunctional DNA primase/polymerase [Ginsengibacter sp.]